MHESQNDKSVDEQGTLILCRTFFNTEKEGCPNLACHCLQRLSVQDIDIRDSVQVLLLLLQLAKQQTFDIAGFEDFEVEGNTATGEVEPAEDSA